MQIKSATVTMSMDDYEAMRQFILDSEKAFTLLGTLATFTKHSDGSLTYSRFTTLKEACLEARKFLGLSNLT